MCVCKARWRGNKSYTGPFWHSLLLLIFSSDFHALPPEIRVVRVPRGPLDGGSDCCSTFMVLWLIQTTILSLTCAKIKSRPPSPALKTTYSSGQVKLWPELAETGAAQGPGLRSGRSVLSVAEGRSGGSVVGSGCYFPLRTFFRGSSQMASCSPHP